MAFFGKLKTAEQTNPKDIFGKVIPTLEPPIDHPLVLRQEISENAAGEIVRIEYIFDDQASGENVYRKRITPVSGDETITGVTIFFPWALQP